MACERCCMWQLGSSVWSSRASQVHWVFGLWLMVYSIGSTGDSNDLEWFIISWLSCDIYWLSFGFWIFYGDVSFQTSNMHGFWPFLSKLNHWYSQLYQVSPTVAMPFQKVSSQPHFMENPIYKWMMWGYPYFRQTHPGWWFGTCFFSIIYGIYTG